MSDTLLGDRRRKEEVIAGAAHAINLDKPDDFNAAVLAFLANK